MSSSVFITSHLVVGDPPTTVSGDIEQVQTAAKAVQVIEAGGTAVLPGGSWEVAEEVLRSFGASEEHVKRQVEQSRNPQGGEIPVAPR